MTRKKYVKLRMSEGLSINQARLEANLVIVFGSYKLLYEAKSNILFNICRKTRQNIIKVFTFTFEPLIGCVKEILKTFSNLMNDYRKSLENDEEDEDVKSGP